MTTQPPLLAESHLPEGWAMPKLEDICEHPQYGWTTSAKKEGEGLKLLRTTDISGQSLDWRSVPFCKEEPPDPEKYLLRKGDIVVSRAGSIGLSYLLGDCPPAVFASYLIRLRASPGVLPEFLRLYLNSPAYWTDMADQAVGIALQNINASKLRELEVPLPPIAEQKRIVEKVGVLMERVSLVQLRLARLSTALKRFRQSVLAAACSGHLTTEWRAQSENGQDLPSGWRWITISDLIPRGGIFDGPFGSNLKTKDYTASGVRVIRLENVGKLRFIEEKHSFISEAKYKTLMKHTVSENDIIFASFISDEVRACVLPKLATRAIAKADCFCLRPYADLIDRRYLALQLVSQETYDAFIGDVHGATRPRINLTQLKQLQVRICPLSEQREIVRRVEALFNLADGIESHCRVATVQTERLPQAILRRALCGELIPTEAELAAKEGREYETASVLLERIQETREQHKPAKSGYGGKKMAQRSRGRQTAGNRKPLDEILREHGKPLTPEQLFGLAGFDEESIDDFYEQLRKLIQAGKVFEKRPNKNDVTLEAVGK